MNVRCNNPTLYLAGLPIDIKAGKVRELFEAVNIETAYTGVVRHRGTEQMVEAIAFVRLVDPAEAEQAIKLLYGKPIGEDHTLKIRKYNTNYRKPAPRVQFRSAPHPTWQGSTWQKESAEAVSQ